MDHETQLIKAFVLRGRKARLIDSLRDSKRRANEMRRLDHFQDLDPRYCVQVPPSKQNSTMIASLSANSGATANGHILSANRLLDGRNMPLLEALDQIVGFGHGNTGFLHSGAIGILRRGGTGRGFFSSAAGPFRGRVRRSAGRLPRRLGT